MAEKDVFDEVLEECQEQERIREAAKNCPRCGSPECLKAFECPGSPDCLRRQLAQAKERLAEAEGVIAMLTDDAYFDIGKICERYSSPYCETNCKCGDMACIIEASRLRLKRLDARKERGEGG